MTEIETKWHLYNSPRYHSSQGGWNHSFEESVRQSGGRLTWEPGALLSTLAFHYVCGDLTPIREVRRLPWLSEIGLDGQPHLLDIPKHDTLWLMYPEVARRLGDLLADEAEQACRDRSEIYVLLSGGLDSRVTAGTLARLLREGRLQTRPVAVTWGLEGSRDVVYARELAKMMEFEWVHVPMDETVVLRNIDWAARSPAAMIMPTHLHKMEWFSGVSPDALVLATSYGDSVGRAEYSAVHLLELKPHRPFNPRGLLTPLAYEQACEVLTGELENLRARTPGEPEYVINEHEMHVHYTRGMLAHAMNAVNDFATVYQMFTDPQVYQFMWSLHPSLRFNEIYGELLHQLDPRLAKVPWARTNQGMKGTQGSVHALPSFHRYRDWIVGPLYEQIVSSIDLERIAAYGTFDMGAVRRLAQEAMTDPRDETAYTLTWFVTLDRLARQMEALGVEVVSPVAAVQPGAAYAGEALMPISGAPLQRPGIKRRLRTRLERSYLLRKWVRDARRLMLRVKALRAYPPRLGLSGF